MNILFIIDKYLKKLRKIYINRESIFVKIQLSLTLIVKVLFHSLG